MIHHLRVVLGRAKNEVVSKICTRNSTLTINLTDWGDGQGYSKVEVELLHHSVPISFGSNGLWRVIALLSDSEQRNKSAFPQSKIDNPLKPIPH